MRPRGGACCLFFTLVRFSRAAGAAAAAPAAGFFPLPHGKDNPERQKRQNQSSHADLLKPQQRKYGKRRQICHTALTKRNNARAEPRADLTPDCRNRSHTGRIQKRKDQEAHRAFRCEKCAQRARSEQNFQRADH